MTGKGKPSTRRALPQASVKSARKSRTAVAEASEWSYKALMDMAGGAGLGFIIIQDSEAQRGTIVFANGEAAKISGRSPEDLLGACVWDLLDAESAIVARDRHELRLKGEGVPQRYELNALHKDGRRVPVEVAVATMPQPGQAATVVFVQDISLRTEIARTLRESEQRYATLVSSLADAVLTSSGVITWCNERAEEILGCTRDEIIGRDARLFFAEGAKAVEWTDTARQVTGEQRYFSGTTTIGPKDGNLVDIEFSVSRIPESDPTEFVTVFRDVTERRRAEEELKDSRERLEILFEYAPDGYYLVDLEGYFVDGNRMAEHISGYGRHELIGRNILEADLIPEDELRVSAAELAENAKGRSTGPTEFNLRRKDGSQVTVEIRSFPVSIKGRDLVLCAARDATERRLAEQALQRAKDELETKVVERTRGLAKANKDLRREVEERRRAEQELRSSQEQFHSLFRAMSEGVAVHEVLCDDSGEPVDCRILDVNPAYESLVGLKRERVVGRMASEFLDPRCLPGFDVCAQVAESGKAARFETYFEPANKHFIVSVFSPATREFATVLFDISENRRAAEALKASEEKYRLVVENASEAIVVAQDGMLKLVNAKVAEVTGYDRSELVGMAFLDVVHPDDHQMVVERHLRRLAGEEFSHVYPFRIVGKDGSVKWVEINAVLFTWEGAPATLNFITDITERRHAHEALQKSEAHYRLLAENVKDVIWTVDASLQYTYVSSSVYNLLGYTAEEVTSIPLEEILTVESLDGIRDALRKEKTARDCDPSPWLSAHTLDVEMYCRDGSTVWVEAKMTALTGSDGRTAGFLGVLRDVTERKKAEEALRHREEYFRSLIENARDVIVIIGRDGRVQYESPAIDQVLGHKPEEALGQDGFEFTHPDDMPRVMEAFAYLVDNPGSTTSIDLRVRAADGSWHDAEAVAQSLLDDPLVQGIVVNFRDVTERKRVEREKRTVEEQLQMAGRLAAVGELAAGVAHELNNPLSAVQAFAQFLSQKEDLDDSIRGDVETIYREAQRATKITGNLLSFARQNKPEQSLLSMNEVLERSLELHGYRMRVNNIEVVKDLDERLPTTMADFHLMQQVFVNIINNAEQAMTEANGGGTLVVKTEVAGKMIRVSFTDDGPGIRNEDLKQVFDPFFTTKEVGRGTGLGLSICYGIVESHGGYLRAESGPGRGAAFIVELPISGEDTTDVKRGDGTRQAHA